MIRNDIKDSLTLRIGAALTLLMVTAIWGSAFVFTKNAIAEMGPLFFLLFRFSIATLLTAALAGRRLLLIDRDMLKKGLITGAALAAGYATQTIGLQYTTVGNSAFITGFYVVLVPFAGCIFNRVIKAEQVALGFAALFGLALFSLNEQFRLNSGDIWTLGCAAIYACHFVLLGHYTRGMDSLLLTLLQLATATILFGLAAPLLESPPHIAAFSGEVWFALAYCAVLASALAFFIQTAAQKILSPTQASLIFTTEALFGAFFGWLLLGEKLLPRQFGGAAILIVCMVVVLLAHGQKE
ncbi:MAG: DMT family transporter [Clostridiales bacterium]|nr:DMT family transporter [Clostridiales bacterium]